MTDALKTNITLTSLRMSEMLVLIQMEFNSQSHNAKLEMKEEEPLVRHLKLTEHSQK